MKSPLRTSVVLLALAAALVLAVLVGRAVAARRAFERELAGEAHFTAAPYVVAAALRVPHDRAVLARLGEALESDDPYERLLAATVVSYWDAPPPYGGLLPRPEHHARPIDELLPLLPALARAQRTPGPLGEVVDGCLVTVWDDETLLQCIEHQAKRAADDARGNRLHAELVGILVNEDPRPVTKDGFSGLVYGYATDDRLRAMMTK